MGLYENLDSIGSTWLRIEAYIFAALAILLVGKYAHARLVRKDERQTTTAAWTNVAMVSAFNIVLATIALALSGANNAFSRVFRAFVAGSLMLTLLSNF